MITGYGPQEKEPLSIREDFYRKLSEVCIKAKNNGSGILLEIDANVKIGSKHIMKMINS